MNTFSAISSFSPKPELFRTQITEEEEEEEEDDDDEIPTVSLSTIQILCGFPTRYYQYLFFPFGATAPVLALAYLHETLYFTAVY
jgi:hypothetical protein